MILELMGPPGAGKTAIAHALAAILDGEVCSFSSSKERGWYCARYAFSSPLNFISLLGATLRNNWQSPRLLRYKFILLVKALARTARARREGRGKTVLLDEGLAQYLLAIQDRELDEREICDYFSKYVGSDVLIIVLAQGQIREARMAKRGRIPRSAINIDQQGWQSLIERNARLLGDTLDIGQTIIVTTDNSGPDELAQKIAASLRV